MSFKKKSRRYLLE